MGSKNLAYNQYEMDSVIELDVSKGLGSEEPIYDKCHKMGNWAEKSRYHNWGKTIILSIDIIQGRSYGSTSYYGLLETKVSFLIMHNSLYPKIHGSFKCTHVTSQGDVSVWEYSNKSLWWSRKVYCTDH